MCSIENASGVLRAHERGGIGAYFGAIGEGGELVGDFVLTKGGPIMIDSW